MSQFSVLLDRSNGRPLYRQISEHIRSLILNGDLVMGAAVPPVRGFAKHLGVASLTVFHAYEDLKTRGLLQSNPRHGFRVATRLPSSVGTCILTKLPEHGPTADYERLAQSTGVRSMASSVADPELFHADEFITEIETMRRDSPWDFYYSEPEGCPELLQQIEKILSRECLGTSGSSHIATNGSMRGLEVLLEIFTNPGDSVLVQEPGRLWLSQLLRIKGVTGFAVKVAGSGIDLDHAQFLIDRHKPKLFFVAPDYGHATGLSMTGPERESVLRLCQSAGVFLVEDAASTALTYHSEKPPPIASLDKSSVAYVGSFSYSLCPALRSGFLHVPARLKPSILSIWEATSISGSRILQTALARYIEQGKYDSHLTRVLPKYRNRRDAMMTALKRAMPLGVSWTTPEGGFSTWLSLAPEYARPDLYASAVSRGVSFAPGSLFLTHGEPENHLRLSFGMLRPEEIEEAVKSLAKALKAK